MEFRRSSKFLKRFFTIISKYHAFWMILSASILTFSCGSDDMGVYILFSRKARDKGGGQVFLEAYFVEIKELCPHASL